MKIRFLGASGEVGRSCILLKSNRKKTLLDCGVKFTKDNAFPIIEDRTVKTLNSVVLSHAHMDHSGYLPYLYKAGYKGKVLMTKPTRDLTQVLLADYLRLSKNMIPYGQKEIKAYLQNCATMEYEEEIAGVKLHEAGHILGSAMTTVRMEKHKVLYTGDVNMRESRLLEGARTGFNADTLITESTYGGDGDMHLSGKQAGQDLVKSIQATFKKGGKVMVPTFAIGRGQEVLFTIESHMRSGTLQEAPIYVDGMINKALRIYRHNADHLKKEIQRRILTSDDDPFKSRYYRIPKKKDRSDVYEQDRAIIVTTSGMLNGGPVLGYLKELAPKKKNKIILVGYQARGTRGRELLEGADELEIDGERVPINLELDEAKFSAHSDQKELLELIKGIKGLKRVFIVHGEKDKSEEFARAVQAKNKHLTVEVPKLGEEYSF